MLLGLVRKHALKGLDLVFRAHSLDVGRHHLVGVLRLDSLGRRLERVPSCQEHIGLLTLGFSADDETVSTGSWEAINMRTEIDLD